MIEVNALVKRYGDERAVDDISFEVPAGQILGFLGSNGAGKTTTMKVITCYLPPSEGTVRVDGLDVRTNSLEIRNRIGYLPEHTPLYHEMVVVDYLKFAADMRGLEVLLMIDPVDVFLTPSLPKYKDHALVSIEKADIAAEDDDTSADRLDERAEEKLIDRFKSVLGDRVEDVRTSDRLVKSAVTLVAGAQGFDAQTERMMRMMDEGFEGSKKILEVNTKHPLIRNLSALRDKPGSEDLVETAVLQLYEGALLMDGALAEPQDFLARMTDLMTRATSSTPAEANVGDPETDE